MRINNNIMKSAVLVIVAALAVGCIMEKDDMADGMRNVLIQVDVSAGMHDTKAVTEPVTAEEGVINTVRIYAFYNGVLCGHYYGGNISGEPIIMDLNLPEKGKHNVVFYVIANEAAMNMEGGLTFGESTTLSQLSSIRFSSVNSLAEYGLPMYFNDTVELDVDAVRAAANSAQGHEGHVFLSQKLDASLKRPFAKITLMAARNDGGSVTVNNVSILAKGTRAYNYLFPVSDELLSVIPPLQNDWVLSGGDMEVTGHVTDLNRNDPASYTELSAGEYIFEVPFGSESWDVPSNTNSVVFHVNYSTGLGGVAKTADIHLPPIVRNTHYKILCSISSEGVISVNYLVSDWTDAEMWQNGLVYEYPSHSSLMPSYNTDVLPEGPAVMSVDQPFTCYFQMQYPEHQTWNPTLLDGAGTDYDVEVWDETSKIENPEDYVAAEGKWYMIKVIPKNPDNAGTAVRLAVTFRSMLSEQAEFLMINVGGKSTYLWPYDGTMYKNDNHYVIITQQ